MDETGNQRGKIQILVTDTILCSWCDHNESWFQDYYAGNKYEVQYKGWYYVRARHISWCTDIQYL